MDKTIAGLIGAVGALVTAGPGHAATASPVAIEALMQPQSYADLLRPIPNAVAVLRARQQAEDLAPAEDPTPMVETVRYHHHHHHHHHHHWRHRRWFHHHWLYY